MSPLKMPVNLTKKREFRIDSSDLTYHKKLLRIGKWLLKKEEEKLKTVLMTL